MAQILCHVCRYCDWQFRRRALYGWWDERCVHPGRADDWPNVGEATACPGYVGPSKLSNFDKALSYLFDQEGTYANVPQDHGGATMFGITQLTYDNWRRSKGLPLQSVRSLKRGEAAVIYQEWYWDAGGCEMLPEVLSIGAFDAMVNHRPRIAIALMQRTLGVPADGVIGPVTQKAYRAATDSPQVVWKFVDARLDLYATIVFDDPSQRAFLKGWLRRAHALEKLIWPDA
jgi:lysozyme family protein